MVKSLVEKGPAIVLQHRLATIQDQDVTAGLRDDVAEPVTDKSFQK